MSPRPALQPGEHGAISVREVTGWSVAPPPQPWAATCRFATADGRVVSLRAFGDSETESVTALEARIAERRREGAPSSFRTLGEAVAAFYAGPGPDRWSEATAATMLKARAHLDRLGAEPWPVSDARARELWGDGSRMSELVLRLLKAVRRS